MGPLRPTRGARAGRGPRDLHPVHGRAGEGGRAPRSPLLLQVLLAVAVVPAERPPGRARECREHGRHGDEQGRPRQGLPRDPTQHDHRGGAPQGGRLPDPRRREVGRGDGHDGAHAEGQGVRRLSGLLAARQRLLDVRHHPPVGGRGRQLPQRLRRLLQAERELHRPGGRGARGVWRGPRGRRGVLRRGHPEGQDARDHQEPRQREGPSVRVPLLPPDPHAAAAPAVGPGRLRAPHQPQHRLHEPGEGRRDGPLHGRDPRAHRRRHEAEEHVGGHAPDLPRRQRGSALRAGVWEQPPPAWGQVQRLRGRHPDQCIRLGRIRARALEGRVLRGARVHRRLVRDHLPRRGRPGLRQGREGGRGGPPPAGQRQPVALHRRAAGGLEQEAEHPVPRERAGHHRIPVEVGRGEAAVRHLDRQALPELLHHRQPEERQGALLHRLPGLRLPGVEPGAGEEGAPPLGARLWRRLPLQHRGRPDGAPADPGGPAGGAAHGGPARGRQQAPVQAGPGHAVGGGLHTGRQVRGLLRALCGRTIRQ
mmetsp:Transcript_55675/g.156782  ORF Transcript_55675/g.156782 Transcript_55675/m.156782 type:complete len:535 (+) Transcript_55675:155-1759(+)